MSDINENKGSAYEAMAEAVKTSFEQLLIPFHAASEPNGPLQGMTPEAFFQKFLVYADKFTGQCCQDFSKILRRASVVPEVRGTPTLQLAKQLREVVFEMPDKILVGYLGALRQINLDLMGVASSIADTSILGEAIKGAAIGRVAGGFGETGKVLVHGEYWDARSDAGEIPAGAAERVTAIEGRRPAVSAATTPHEHSEGS